jgi:cytochrome c oxidase subunit 2
LVPRGWVRRGPLLSILAAFAAVGLAGCGTYPQTTFSPAGPVASRELAVWNVGLIIVLCIFAVVGAALLYAVVRFRERRGDNELPPQVEGNNRLEVLWTVGPVLILALLAIPTIRYTFYTQDAAPGPNPVQITVVGHQWWWAFDYTQHGVVTADEMVIPVGRPVQLSLQSADVIHSFWVPALAGTTDLIPGVTNHMWLQADHVGVYPGQCKQFCGTEHAMMVFDVKAVSPAAYAAWLAEREHPVTAPQTALEKQGYQVFQSEPCGACHTVSGTQAKGTVGPNLTGIGSRDILAVGFMKNTPQNMARWITKPSAVEPGTVMPDLGLNPTQVKAVVAYLESLK